MPAAGCSLLTLGVTLSLALGLGEQSRNFPGRGTGSSSRTGAFLASLPAGIGRACFNSSPHIRSTDVLPLV